MEEFDDHLPDRRFDNFQFVDFHSARESRNKEAAFALAALMEVPEQYMIMMELGYFSNNMEIRGDQKTTKFESDLALQLFPFSMLYRFQKHKDCL